MQENTRGKRQKRGRRKTEQQREKKGEREQRGKRRKGSGRPKWVGQNTKERGIRKKVRVRREMGSVSMFRWPFRESTDDSRISVFSQTGVQNHRRESSRTNGGSAICCISVLSLNCLSKSSSSVYSLGNLPGMHNCNACPSIVTLPAYETQLSLSMGDHGSQQARGKMFKSVRSRCSKKLRSKKDQRLPNVNEKILGETHNQTQF